MRPPAERSLAPELSIVDVLDDLVWHRDGSVTLLYRIEAYHEAGMSDEDFDQAAFDAENAWSTLPEGTSYQFMVFVDHHRGRKAIESAWPPIAVVDERTRLLEEFRAYRVRELVRIDESGGAAALVQERRHYLAATFRPRVLQRSLLEELAGSLRTAWGLLSGSGRPPLSEKYSQAYERIVAESATYDRRVTVSLLNIGLGFSRCRTSEIVSVLYRILNPSSSRFMDLQSLSDRARRERERLPKSIIEEYPFLEDTSPVWSLTEDDMLVRKEFLRVGDLHASVVSLKSLPDRTEPGALVPLLHLGRNKYLVCYRIDIPRAGAELAALRAKATLAAGLQLKDLLVRSDRKDPHAAAVERQSGEAMERIIASTQRIVGTSLQVVLYESSPEALDEGVEECLGVMGRAHGLRGYRETYGLKRVWLSLLPGAPIHQDRRKRTLTPNAVDMMPIFDFRGGEGKVPFLTPTNAVVWVDPFDATKQSNANMLITGTSGSGKSVAACTLISGYEVACAARGEPAPYVFFMDNGESYARYMRLRRELGGDGRYVAFTFDTPPGVDIWSWAETEESLEEHISRLELLLLDILRVNEADEERFEKVKAAASKALFDMYKSARPRDFKSFAQALQAAKTPEADGLLRSLYPFTEGKFKRLFEPNAELAMNPDVHAICFDFKGLGEHKDLMALALRLVIYEVRRWSARMSRRRHRSFLLLDESWAMLDAGSGSASVASKAAPFLAASIRMGRKEGLGVLALSQQIEDFGASAYGAAILGNSASKLIGHPGGEGVEGLRRHLRLTDRQVEQVRGLRRTDRFHEFLLIQGAQTHVVRVVLDPFARWVFTTAPKDRDRLAALAESRPDLSLFDQIRLLADGAA